MPNWTTNIITIKHDNKSLIDAIAALEQSEVGVLQHLLPCPEELKDDDLTTWSRGPEQAARDAKKAALKAKYGFESWYDWNIAHWGTKWDLCEPSFTREDDNTIVIHCQTAWSPPLDAFMNIKPQGYRIRCMYSGEGHEYAGIYEDGNDQYYSQFKSGPHARQVLPQELDDAFNIADDLDEWAEEQMLEEDLYRFVKEGEEAKKESV